MKCLTTDKNIIPSNPLKEELPLSKGLCRLMNSSSSVYQEGCSFVLSAVSSGIFVVAELSYFTYFCIDLLIFNVMV